MYWCCWPPGTCDYGYGSTWMLVVRVEASGPVRNSSVCALTPSFFVDCFVDDCFFVEACSLLSSIGPLGPWLSSISWSPRVFICCVARLVASGDPSRSIILWVVCGFLLIGSPIYGPWRVLTEGGFHCASMLACRVLAAWNFAMKRLFLCSYSGDVSRSSWYCCSALAILCGSRLVSLPPRDL